MRPVCGAGMVVIVIGGSGGGGGIAPGDGRGEDIGTCIGGDERAEEEAEWRSLS